MSKPSPGMSVVDDYTPTSFNGESLAILRGTTVELLNIDSERATLVAQVTVASELRDLRVAVSGRSFVGHDPSYTSVWRWERDADVSVLATRSSPRDFVAGDLVTVDGTDYTLLQQHQRLDVLDGETLIARANVGPPRGLRCLRFVMLAGRRLAVLAMPVDDPTMTFVVVSWDTLLGDAATIQTAMAAMATPGNRVDDYAWFLEVGPAPGNAIIVARDNEDTEEIEDREPGDIRWAHRGFYFMDLDTGAMREPIPFTGSFEGTVGLCATEQTIALHRRDALVTISRQSGAVTEHTASAIALDVANARVAMFDGTTWNVRSVDQL